MPYSYKTLTRALELAGIEEAADEAALLLMRCADVSRITLLLERDRFYDSPALEEAVRRRLAREPLQYILGEWDFFGLPFTVSPHCLVPRPDTECLVEEAIRLIPKGGRFIDLCTGSGCIAVATLANRPDLQAAALELYPETLALAVKNAADNGVAPRFTPVEADLLQGGAEALEGFAPVEAILSNPPYIPSSVIPTLSPEVRQEPAAALDGGEDGLVFYRAILRDYVRLLAPGGVILLEIGYDQGDALRALCAQYLPTAQVDVLRDLGGCDRVVRIRTQG
jgi:release factor glutamine methyltransferase